MDYIKFYKNKDVLVTGGYGFIGGNLVHDLIKLGANVTVIDSLLQDTSANKKNLEDIESKFKSVIADLSDFKVAEDVVKGKEIIFHLAGQTSHTISMNNPLIDVTANTLTTLSLLEACRKNNKNVKILFTSTRQVYGKPQHLPVDENHPLNPPDVNAINKISAEQYLLLYDKIYGIKSNIFRLTNTYGPRQIMKMNSQQVIPVFIRLLIEGKSITIFGDGKQLRDLNYVDDVNNALLLAGASDIYGEIFNLGDSNYKSLLDIAQEIIKVNDGGNYSLIPFPEERKKIDIGDSYLDTKKIKSILGWQPKTNFKDGVKKTLAYFKGKEEYYF